MRVAAIYALVNRHSGKLYIGSSINVRKRCRVHFMDLRFKRHHSQHLQRAFNRCPEAFYVEIIEECEPKALITREQFWITFFQAATPEGGYNVAPRAGSCLGVRATEATRRKISEAHKRRTNYPVRRPVLQYNTAGEFLAKFGSVTEAEAAFGTRIGVANACNGRNTHAGGFQWRYEDQAVNPERGIGPKPNRKWKAGVGINQYDKDGKLIASYPTVLAAGRGSGIHEGVIRLVSKRAANPFTGGYRWERIKGEVHGC